MKYMEAVEVRKAFNLVPELLDVPYSRIWTGYDKEADVLYLNFKKPSHADDSELTDGDLIIRYERGVCRGNRRTQCEQKEGWIWARGMIRRVVLRKLHHMLNCVIEPMLSEAKNRTMEKVKLWDS